jgi:hypothetical protein
MRTRIIEHWSKKFALEPVLVAILLLQGIVSSSLWNTAFQDEALYLYAGRQIFTSLIGGPPVLEDYSSYFSGLPYLYPVLAGALDIVGGLELARAFSLCCMLFVTSAVYIVASHLIDRSSACIAASLFAFQGSVLFLGRLATYDAMCLALLALATILTMYTGRERWLLPTLLSGPILLLALATKYAGILFVPTVLSLVVLQTWRTVGFRQALLRAIVPMMLMVAAAGGLLVASDKAQDGLIGLRSTTTDRIAVIQTDRSVLVIKAAQQGGLLLLLGLLGWLLGGRRHALLGLVLIGTAFLAPAYHIYKAEMVSMHKHIAFGLFFVAPLAGLAVARISGYKHGRAMGRLRLAGLAIFLLIFGVGFRQAQGFYAEWANSDQLIRVLRSQVRPGGGRILAEEMEVPRYYLQDIGVTWHWNQLYLFDYTDIDGRELQGEEAYKVAIAEGYFDLVVLRYGPNAAMAHAIDDGLKNGEKYEQIARIPHLTTFGEGNYWVWRKR